jgi:hypothetical protein
MAFTANSLGHMARYQEWYGEKEERTEWALRTAMNTIASVSPSETLMTLPVNSPARAAVVDPTIKNATVRTGTRDLKRMRLGPPGAFLIRLRPG